MINSETLIEMLRTDRLTEEDVGKLDQMIAAYPWFGPVRFLRLKAMHQLGREPGLAEPGLTAVFSCDRSHLYRYIRGEVDLLGGVPGVDGSELEFITDDDDVFEGEEDQVMLEDESPHEKGIPEKEEEEMEEPENEEPDAVPVIDPLDDETDGEKPENEEPDAVPLSATPDEQGDDKGVAGSAGPANQSTALIEQFLNSEAGVIKADKETSLEGDISERSVKEDDSFITDTLAKIYVKQGLHAKAIYAYERLSLKYPEKSAYFAAQIEKIKNSTNI
jgi:hypothetical protein